MLEEVRRAARWGVVKLRRKVICAVDGVEGEGVGIGEEEGAREREERCVRRVGLGEVRWYERFWEVAC